MCLAPTCAATFSSARHTFRSSGVRSQFDPGIIVIPAPHSVSDHRPYPLKRRIRRHTFLPSLLSSFLFHIGPDPPGGEYRPRHDRHALQPCHGYDIAFQITLEDAPRALVHRKRSLTRQTGVRVRAGDNPCRRIRDTLRISQTLRRKERRQSRSWTYEIQDFSLSDEVVQTVHDLLDAGSVIPPMHIENVDVVCLEFLERRLHGDVQRLDVVPEILRLLLELGCFQTLVVRRVLT